MAIPITALVMASVLTSVINIYKSPNNRFQGTSHYVRRPLNRDVGHMNNRLPHVHWTFHIDNAKKSDHTVTLRTMGQSRTAENQMNSPTRRSTVRRTRRRR